MGLEELKPDEHILLGLVQEYGKTIIERDVACHSLSEQITQLMALRDDIAKPYNITLADLEAKIKLPMLDRKASFISSFGTVTYRKGAVRRTWNLDALDQICTAKPEIKENIWAFRKETVGEPTISIKIE